MVVLTPGVFIKSHKAINIQPSMIDLQSKVYDKLYVYPIEIYLGGSVLGNVSRKDE